MSGDGRLPSEAALCNEFAASRTTIRQALGVLKSQGLLKSRRGAGTFMVGASVRRPIVRASGDPLHHGLGTRVQVLSLDTIPSPAYVSDFLRLRPKSDVFRVIRVHRIGRVPLSVVVTYLPPNLKPAIKRSGLYHASLHEILWRKCGLKLGRSVHIIRAQGADEVIARLLEIPLMDPVLHIRAEGYLANGQPIRLTENFFSEDYQYATQIQWARPKSSARRLRSGIRRVTS
jgi:GntR family transcriptional regulator